MTLLRYYHTLRYLRAVQIYGRLWHWLNPSRPDLRPAPARRKVSGRWMSAVTRRPCLLDHETFRLLNHIGRVRTAQDWNDPTKEKLWLYNLHYFDDLNALGAEGRCEWHKTLIERWVLENPPGYGNGWEAYPTSLRVVNWIKWALRGHTLPAEWLHSLAVQVRWLQRNIEWHLLGNHLFANAKALVFAGLFFEGTEAARWLAKGLKILQHQVSEQILDDGGHFELSPMYHAIILEDVLDLINAACAWPGCVPEERVSLWRDVAARMLTWLDGMTHPDGGIAFFNDAALGVAADYATLTHYAQLLSITPYQISDDDAIRHFSDSGYIRLDNGAGAVALLDVARIGPDYLPGHAHADTLSFELSLFGQRVVVNSGTSCYGLWPERLWQRGTAAHSTVEIDDANSSEVWSSFRVARRARPFGLFLQQNRNELIVSCAHDGYQRLPGRPVHRRCWRLKQCCLQVVDTIEGGYHKAKARFYIHPAVNVVNDSGSIRLTLPDGRKVYCSPEGGTARVVQSLWYPEFGVSLASRMIEVSVDNVREFCCEFLWD